MIDEKGNDKCKQFHWESMDNETNYSYTNASDNKVADSEKTKYVIRRDGIVITVEGSDYTKVKELIEDIENTLDEKSTIK
jgi:leucyl aminopeptidase (aminopeptidase T)